MVINLWRYRRLILHNAIDDLRNRYRGSIAGYLWNVFIPLAQIIVFSTIFSALMGYRFEKIPEGMPTRFNFVIFLCSGLLPWNAFADTLMRGVASLVGNAGYLKKLPVPEQLFVAQDACSGLFSGFLAVVIFLVFCVLAAGYGPFWAWWQVVPGMILFMGFAFGLGLLLSCLNVLYRDVQPLMNVVVLLWFWLTPIVYVEDIFRGTDKEWMLTVLPMNPAYHFVEVFHRAVFEHAIVPAHTWLTCLVIALVVNALAYAVLRRLRSDIRDVL
jgi:lipopolysaccharide transport system permease protein